METIPAYSPEVIDWQIALRKTKANNFSGAKKGLAKHHPQFSANFLDEQKLFSYFFG